MAAISRIASLLDFREQLHQWLLRAICDGVPARGVRHTQEETP
jgi:hypothetical protein